LARLETNQNKRLQLVNLYAIAGRMVSQKTAQIESQGLTVLQ